MDNMRACAVGVTSGGETKVDNVHACALERGWVGMGGETWGNGHAQIARKSRNPRCQSTNPHCLSTRVHHRAKN